MFALVIHFPGARMSSRRRSFVELLEHRQLFSGGLLADHSRLIFNAIANGAPAAAQTVMLTNTSTSPLTVAPDGEMIDGADAAEFSFVGDALPITLQPG